MPAARLAAALLLLPTGAALAAAPAGGLTTAAATLKMLPEARLPAAEMREQVQALKHQPLRFAVPAALNLDLRNGQWDSSAPGLARWRLRVESEAASSLSLLLTGVNLPEGAALWFYDSTGGDVQGPFDRHSPGLVNGQLQLPLVRHGSAVLELQVPEASRNAVTLQVAKAYHGYREFGPKVAPGAGDSGSCNVNVVCPAGNNWRDQIRSTVLLTIGGDTVCSGSLVNNTRQDDRALVLTANHCQIRSTNIAQVTAYFNVQSSTCSGDDNGRVDQNIPALSFLARDENSDFTLFALASAPPSAYNVFYAGWDVRSGVAPQSGVAIHHPSGDEKKISTYSTPGVAEEDVRIGDPAPFDGFNVDAWRITWSNATTEPASSGSGLWNQNKQLVGVLSGGGASCSTPSEPDFFGRLERAWIASSASSGQLKAHLDPTNTGCLQLASKNPGRASPIASCTGETPTNPTPSDDEGGGGSIGLGALMLLAAVGSRRRLLAHRAF